MLHLQPLTFKEACMFVAVNHRHYRPPQGHLFSIGVNDGESIVGVCIVGRPVARGLQDGYTAEVTRCCIIDGVKNGCSKLYGAAWRAARAMGYRRLVTYTLQQEGGASLRAAGWQLIGEAGGGNLDCPSRPRVSTPEELRQKKFRWERTAPLTTEAPKERDHG